MSFVFGINHTVPLKPRHLWRAKPCTYTTNNCFLLCQCLRRKKKNFVVLVSLNFWWKAEKKLRQKLIQKTNIHFYMQFANSKQKNISSLYLSPYPRFVFNLEENQTKIMVSISISVLSTFGLGLKHYHSRSWFRHLRSRLHHWFIYVFIAIKLYF